MFVEMNLSGSINLIEAFVHGSNCCVTKVIFVVLSILFIRSCYSNQLLFLVLLATQLRNNGTNEESYEHVIGYRAAFQCAQCVNEYNNIHSSLL